MKIIDNLLQLMKNKKLQEYKFVFLTWKCHFSNCFGIFPNKVNIDIFGSS